MTIEEFNKLEEVYPTVRRGWHKEETEEWGTIEYDALFKLHSDGVIRNHGWEMFHMGVEIPDISEERPKTTYKVVIEDITK